MSRIVAVARLLAVTTGVIALLVGALAVGQTLNGWRGTGGEPEPSTGTAAAAGGGTVIASPAPSPIVAFVTRDQAIALVHGLNEVVRADRIEAKLVPWSEFAAVGMGVDRTGGPAHGGGAPRIVWAVAVAGDLYPNLGDRVPRVLYPWALYGINAERLQVSTLKVDSTGSWPPGFDALADHVAVAAPPPTPSPEPIRFDHLVAAPGYLTRPIRAMSGSDTDGRELWAVVLTGSRDAMGREGTALVRSDTGGASWTVVTSGARNPFSVASAGATVLVADPGADTADNGTSTSGGLFVSTDGGATWQQAVRDGVLRVRAFAYHGRTLFLAERWWASKGAATGPSHILGSFDATMWRDIGTVPGPASFGMLDVPLVTYAKNTPGDGFYRVDGPDLPSLRLVPIAGSVQACCGEITIGPAGDLWTFVGASRVLRRSTDGARAWHDASTGLAGRIAGLFVWHGALYAIGDGAYRWSGTAWEVAAMWAAKADGVFQIGTWVFVFGTDRTLYKAPR